MKIHVLFLQGASKGAYKADALLADSLRKNLGAAYEVRYPALPNEDEPDYQAWKSRILAELTDMGADAILVGHSIGASVAIKLLTEEKPALAGVFLIASPFWHNDDFWHWEDAQLPEDARSKLPKGLPLFIYHGDEDEVVPFSHFAMYSEAFPRATIRRLAGRGHQLDNDLGDVARDIKALPR